MILQNWGYETRILNTKILEQVNSIKTQKLNQYSGIEKHIKENIQTLKSDI